MLLKDNESAPAEATRAESSEAAPAKVQVAREEVVAHFKKLGVDMDGSMGFAEIEAAEKTFGLPTEISANSKDWEDGLLSLREFIGLLEQNGHLLAVPSGTPAKMQVAREEVVAHFKELDVDMDGSIGLAEIEAAEKRFGLPMEISANSKDWADGKVTLKEFIGMLEKNGNIPGAEVVSREVASAKNEAPAMLPRPKGRRSCLLVVGSQNDHWEKLNLETQQQVTARVTDLLQGLVWDSIVIFLKQHPKESAEFLSTHISKGSNVSLGDVRDAVSGLTYRLAKDHCVAGTTGAEMAPEVAKALSEKDCFQVLGGTNPDVPSLSAFRDLQPGLHGVHQTSLFKHLRSETVTDVYVVGAGLEGLPKQTALDARELGFNTYVVTDGCASFDAEEGRRTRIALEKAGVHLLQSSVLLGLAGDKRVKAAMYMEKHGIHSLFKHLAAQLVYNQPSDPREFLLKEVAKLQMQETAGFGRFAMLTYDDLDTMFGMLDPVGLGKVSGKQVLRGLKGLSVRPPHQIDTEAHYDREGFAELMKGL